MARGRQRCWSAKRARRPVEMLLLLLLLLARRGCATTVTKPSELAVVRFSANGGADWTDEPTPTPWYIANYEWILIASCTVATLIVGYIAYLRHARTGELLRLLTLGGNVLIIMSNLASDVLFCYSFESWSGWMLLCLNAFLSAGLLVKLLSELELALDEIDSIANGGFYALVVLAACTTATFLYSCRGFRQTSRA